VPRRSAVAIVAVAIVAVAIVVVAIVAVALWSSRLTRRQRVAALCEHKT
jgi:FtsZ-interacting cell division protein ZipA